MCILLLTGPVWARSFQMCSLDLCTKHPEFGTISVDGILKGCCPRHIVIGYPSSRCMYSCKISDMVKYPLVPYPPSSYSVIKNDNTGFCLDVPNGETGVSVQTYECADNNNQHWTYLEGTSQILWTGLGGDMPYCLSLNADTVVTSSCDWSGNDDNQV